MTQWPKLVYPRKMSQGDFWGEVSKIAGNDDIKPSLAVINDQEMILFTNHAHSEQVSHYSREQIRKRRYHMVLHTVMYRTEDGGKTWVCCGHMPFHCGYEASATVIGGVIYVQTHEFPNIYADHDNLIDRIFCSEDKGYTWYETRIDSAYLGVSESASMCLNRNFIQLADGSVAGFVSVDDNGYGYTVRLTSVDHGRSWKQDRVTERGVYTPDNPLTPLLEAFFFRTPESGRLMAISRVVWSQFTQEQLEKIPKAVIQEQHADIDNVTGMLLLESKDEGLTWDPVQGLGCLGMMYPSIVYINGEDFIFTYTVRSNTTKTPYPHMGLQAVVGKELPDGSFDIDFDYDIIIDDRTPDYSENGSAFGTTNKLSDGSFITPYSYRINTPGLEKVLREAVHGDEAVFAEYYKRAGEEQIDYTMIEKYRDASYDLRRHIINKIAEQRKESYCKTEVLRWKVNL